MIHVGLIGTGDMGMRQAQALVQSRRFRIVAGSDIAPASRAAFATRFPQAGVYDDHRKLIRDAKVQAVVIATSAYYHRPIAIDAMKAGRDVLCEKPMGRTAADCRRMLDVREKTGRLLMIAHCRRYDANWGTFAKVYREGRLGPKVLWRHCVCDQGPSVPWFWNHRLGGGPIVIAAVHDLDFAAWLFGDPKFVHASGIRLSDATAIDTATAVVHYANGSQLLISWSWNPAPTPRLNDVLGAKGTLTFPGDAYYLTDRATGKRRRFAIPKADMYLAQARHFADCLEHGATCLSPGTEAIKAVATAEAILAAAPRGRVRTVAW